MDAEAAARLPFGFILLDENGVVVDYHPCDDFPRRLTRDTVRGRQFFGEVAPCASVQEFQGRFERMVRAGTSASEHFAFEFRFDGGGRMVRISLTFDATLRRVAVLVDSVWEA
jgi:photoactive yellow protein